MSIFNEAALTYFKCQPEDIEIRIITDDKEAVVVHNAGEYKITTREALYEEVEIQLTDKRTALDIDLGCWIQATKNTVKMNHILGILVRTIQDAEEAKKLLIAVGLGSYSDDTEVAFWEILSRIDPDGELLGNAMIIVAHVYNGPGLIEDITELQIMHGQRVYNKFVDGIFETIYVDDEKQRTFEFFIYSAEHYFTE
ncbi:MAG: hypothetical protein JWP44_2486 [Mucilaginibacter sp.]|nr:hypothetical protein [Mucilaginibacter sp.]